MSVALNVCYDYSKILKPILIVCVKKHVFCGPLLCHFVRTQISSSFILFFLLDPVLQFLLSNIQDSKLSSVSASAIESLCMSCYLQMTKYFDVLAQVKNW